MSDMHETRPAPTVLIAEDDSAMRQLLVWTLHKGGYDVIEYDSGDALLAGMLRARWRRPPAVVIADVCMPGRSGLSVLRELREHGPVAPVVFITAFACEDTLNEAFRLGASIVLSKPFSMDDLRRVVQCFVPPDERPAPRVREPNMS